MSENTTPTVEQGAEGVFKVTWTEVSTHEVYLTEAELRSLRKDAGEEIDPDDDDFSDEDEGYLADGLAQLDDDGFIGLTREDISIEYVGERPVGSDEIPAKTEEQS